MTNSDITHLTQAIMELKGQIERMSERQEEMVDDVKKIKVYCIICISLERAIKSTTDF